MATDKSIQTRLTHTGYNADTYLGSINPPVVRASTVTFPNAQSYLDGSYAGNTASLSDDRPVSYGIQGVEPMESMLSAIRDLEHANHAFVVESGLLAVTAPILALVKSGDHILCMDNIYSPSRRFLEKYLTQQFNVTVDYVSPTADVAHVESLVKSNTTLFLMESPGSLTFEIPDLAGLYDMCKRHGIKSITDNSWGSGYFYKALNHGADISVIAGTKYIGGHSDILMGTIACNDDSIAERISNFITATGTYVSPDELYLALRGIRTLPVRMDAQYKSMLTVAQWLNDHPRVERVLCPALPTDKYHQRFTEYYTGSASLFSIILKDTTDEQACQFIDNLELFRIGASWGGYDSLATPNKVNTARTQDKIWDTIVIRLHIGLDHTNDIIADLEQSLNKL